MPFVTYIVLCTSNCRLIALSDISERRATAPSGRRADANVAQLRERKLLGSREKFFFTKLYRNMPNFGTLCQNVPKRAKLG